MKRNNIAMLLNMAHSPIRNYVVPGVTSSLIGGASKHGTVRLFECEREQMEAVTPHSHRFDLTCLVLAGTVIHRIWRERHPGIEADLYGATKLVYEGAPGKYTREDVAVGKWAFDESLFKVGEFYSMTADEIHSVVFSRGAKVLIFEGPQVRDHSIILEPYVDGKTIQTMNVEPWMFDTSAPSGVDLL